MGRTFFISDTHFGDNNILRYEKRPFQTVAEMDKRLIDNWNTVVSHDDVVYHLGDFGGQNREMQKAILLQLHGKKYLVKGNHDIYDNEYYRKLGFLEVYDVPIILNDFFILSHASLYMNTAMPYANIFGHVHNNPAYITSSGWHYCVCVERVGYTPICLEQIRDVLLKQRNCIIA